MLLSSFLLERELNASDEKSPLAPLPLLSIRWLLLSRSLLRPQWALMNESESKSCCWWFSWWCCEDGDMVTCCRRPLRALNGFADWWLWMLSDGLVDAELFECGLGCWVEVRIDGGCLLFFIIISNKYNFKIKILFKSKWLKLNKKEIRLRL